MYVHTLQMCVEYTETRRRYWITRDLSYRKFLVIMWVLGIKPRSLDRAVRALNHSAISLRPFVCFSGIKHKTYYSKVRVD